MDGRFLKLVISKDQFIGSGGIYCNNDNAKIMFKIMKKKFGKPNGNILRKEESTWKYVLKYEQSFLSVYDYNNSWSIGFLEVKNLIPDYELINVISKMLFNYLNNSLNKEINLCKNLKITV